MVNVQKLQAAVAGGRVGDAHAIDQNQALSRLGTANKNTRQAAAPTCARYLNTRHAGQQIRDAGGLQPVDVIAGKHGVGCTGLRAVFDLAVGADQGIGQLQGAVTVDRVGEEGGGRQAQQ
ncbi:hypothetical protein D3C75_1144620 [compost metagenome]